MDLKKWIWKSQPKAVARNERYGTLISNFQLLLLLVLEVCNHGGRMAVWICYCNPGSGQRSSSCQWQLDIRWTQGTTVKWGERITGKQVEQYKWWKRCFWQEHVRDVYIYNFKGRFQKTNSVGSLNISLLSVQ